MIIKHSQTNGFKAMVSTSHFVMKFSSNQNEIITIYVDKGRTSKCWDANFGVHPP